MTIRQMLYPWTILSTIIWCQVTAAEPKTESGLPALLIQQGPPHHRPANPPVRVEKEPEPQIQQEPPRRRPESLHVKIEEITDATGYHIQGIVPTDYRFAVRANLLHWATLAPDIGFEWRMGRTYSLLVHGAWTHWSWNDRHRIYRLWKVAPEFRWYLGLHKQWHVGAQYQIGRYNIMLGDRGYQGRFQGGSLVGGYQFIIGKHLILDLTLGMGGTHLDYTKYERPDNVNRPVEKKTKNWWGPNQAAITLGWRIGK